MLFDFIATHYVTQIFIVAGVFGAFAVWYSSRSLERADIRSKQFEREKRVAIEYTRKNATDIGHIEGD